MNNLSLSPGLVANRVAAVSGDRFVQWKRVAVPLLLVVSATSAFSYGARREYLHPVGGKNYVDFYNDGNFVNQVSAAMVGSRNLGSLSSSDETGAPLWLVERMKALRQTPPATLEKVRAQMKASGAVRRR